MKWGQMKIKMAAKGQVIDTKKYGACKVVLAEYNPNLNWWEYVIETEFGNKRITNDQIDSRKQKRNYIIEDDLICPVTMIHCEDECCPSGATCNLKSDGIFM
jgi:hypothetical protein